MRERFARIGLIALVAVMALPAPAWGDAGGITTLVPTKAEEPEKPPAFKGFSLNYTLQDTSGLNAINYNNSIYQLFEPSWALGKVAFPKASPFSRLNIGMRWPLTYTLAGYDPTAVSPDNSHGTPTPCSNLTPSENGSINASQVQRCPYSNTYRATPGDLSIAISNPAIFTIPKAELRFNPGIRFTVPLSYESRFATERFAIQGVVGVSRNFFGDKLSVAYSFGATKFSYQSTSPQVQGSANPLPDAPISANYRSADAAATTAAFYASPGNLTSPMGMNTDFAFSHVLSVGYNPTDKWSFSVLYVLSDAFAYAAPCGVANYGGVQTDPCANANTASQASHQTGFSGTLNSSGWSEGTAGRAHHDSQVFYLTASYQLKDWVGLSVAWATFAPLRMPDNSWRQPFFWTDYDSFSSLNVGATFTLGYNNN